MIPSSSALRRLVGASAAVAGVCGFVVGAFLFDGVPDAARLFFGGLLGLVTGALIGAVSGLTGALVAHVTASTRRGGGRDAIGQRVAFAAAGTATALALSWSVLPPLGQSARLLLLVPLAAVTAVAAAVIERRYSQQRKA